jgi:hypothetical protein
LFLEGDCGYVSKYELVSFGEVLFVAEDCYVLADEAVCDSFPAVDECAAHNDGVLYLRVSDGGVVSDACVGAYVGVWAYLAVLADYYGVYMGGLMMPDSLRVGIMMVILGCSMLGTIMSFVCSYKISLRLEGLLESEPGNPLG